MSLKLRLLSIYTPKFLLKRELDDLDSKTTTALRQLLKEQSLQKVASTVPSQSNSLESKREEMAKTHNELVLALTEAMGREKAVELGRERLFQVGMEIGRRAGKRLGVSNSLEDMIRAAKIMYKVLGINFNILRDEKGTKMMVYQCALSHHYTPDACEVLSAADEGVVQGLNPDISMRFVERITSGHRNCVARIDVLEKEVGG